MGFSLEVKTQSFGVDDQSWLGARLGMDTCRSITVDLSLFVAEHAPDGFIPSGAVLGIVTATGLYGPYDNAAVDGREVARGLLFTAIRTKDADQVALAKSSAALFWMGIVKKSKLPNFAGAANGKGEVDVNAETDLPHIRWEA